MVQESIMRSVITANNFDIKLTMIQMIHNNLQFRGTMTEDPNQHLKRFLQLCDTLKYNGVTNDAICLRLFLFFLIDNAFSWHQDLSRPGMSSLDSSYRSSSLIAKQQLEGESFHEAWEHFKTLIKKCLHHGFPEWMQLQVFYNGLDAFARSGLDGVVRGALMNRTYEDAYELIEKMAMNSC
ncbi:oligopeptide transporter 4-like [Gossypium australe]|uniref:Oligopeptide transporter 4-like n=1 Tax=Gossypium australe TaxID=47621 RepID=A0A5B6W8I4_9ROSI|nr:oligopeptide transporter 4-like [Gossypium australe]